jgi:NAD(P)-dependent dehydrogenase (short-subunit alcohol dehydrogenase family)
MNPDKETQGMEIKGAGAIVFGGASGLGEATARQLAKAGAKVLIADLAADRARTLAKELGAQSIGCDVTDSDSVTAAVATATELGDRGLRISVTCAGLGTPARLIGRDGPTPLDQFAQLIEVNLIGTINALRVAAAAISARPADPTTAERGVCINTASIAAYDGQIGQVAYAASKGGVVGLTLPVARELAPRGVRVMTIAPGLFDTPMLAGLPDSAREALGNVTPFPARLGSPAEYAELVAHIIANPMLNGEVIRLDGALRMAPR